MPQIHHSDVIGSLLRPRYLQQARDAFAAGQLPAPDFKRIEDRAVDQAIAMQEGIGLDVITDGELRRFSSRSAHGIPGFCRCLSGTRHARRARHRNAIGCEQILNGNGIEPACARFERIAMTDFALAKSGRNSVAAEGGTSITVCCPRR